VQKTKIEWTDASWNPVRARRTDTGAPLRMRHGNPEPLVGTFCTRISPGCTHCYASTINKRFGNGLEYTVPNLEKVEFFIDENILEDPLRRKKPTKIFVGDMFDLFHEAIPRQLIRQVFEVIHKADWHTFQILTKRAAIMREFLSAWWGTDGFDKHVHCGVSVEDQQRADERILLLLQTPAAVRWLSVEPMLEAVTLDSENWKGAHALGCGDDNHKDSPDGMCRGVDWVVCGGESGPGARPFNLAWAESLLEQCRAAGVPFFMKQVGTNPVGEFFSLTKYPTRGEKTNMRERRFVLDTKGGVMAEWPEHLRVRQFPSPKRVTA
jgi:protein gp37